jgi:hypothetical protein
MQQLAGISSFYLAQAIVPMMPEGELIVVEHNAAVRG